LVKSGKKVAYVFQQYHLIPSLTALENVLLPLTFGR
jgi:ABC-type lipoprotein export system ATPase subunit